MKTAIVTGAGGFIGHHLVKYLKAREYEVIGIDIKEPEFSQTHADNFLQIDLTKPNDISRIVFSRSPSDTEFYNLAARMGGMGFISSDHVASVHDSSLINTHTIDWMDRLFPKGRYFFSSSACVYPTHRQSDLSDPTLLTEEDAYPANPNEAYGWEKLMHEIRCDAYKKEMGLLTRIARFENTYGPEGTYDGGREKAPAAICRKVAMARDGDEIEIWGDGEQTRSFMYVDDCVEGIYRIMQSDCSDPINLGSEEIVTINQLAQTIIDVSGKKLTIKHVDGPQGVRSRRISHEKAKSLLGWEAKVSLKEGLTKTYEWIDNQVKSKQYFSGIYK